MTDQPPQKTSTSPIPENETERLAALHRYNILDTPPEAAFDRITRLAARLFEVPTTLISLVDESRAWFKSCIGFDGQDVPRDVTLCSFSVLTSEPLIIPDTRLDDRFTCNPIVQGEPGVRFYAGAPLLSHDGFNLGTLCLIDSQPRAPLTTEQQATLVDLAAMVVDELELRLAAQRVAQSDEKYRMLFESIDEGFCIVEVLFAADGRAIDHRILQANPAFSRHSGISNPTGKTASELAPDIEQHWNDLYAQVIHTGEPVRLENRSDALNRWFSVLVSRVGDAATCQVVIVFNDITDRKQAEAALRESEELRQRILESSNDCIKVLNLESEILYISQGGLCLLEINDAALVLNANWINFWQDEAQEQAITAIATAKAGNMSRFQGNCPTLKGTPKWWDSVITPVRDAAGQVVQLVAISRDITQQKQVDDLLRDSEEMFRNMADHAPFMVWVTDPSGYCTYLSQSWYDFTGQTPASGLGFGWLERTHPGDRGEAEQIFLNANEQQKAFRLEYRLQGKDGEYIWAIDAASPRFGVDGQFKGYIGSVIDISDRKQVEAEREQLLQREQSARVEAERANRIKDEFLAVLSHELRSPLNPILGWTRLLQTDKLDKTRQRAALATIERNAKLQTQLIEDLLDISRILQGKLSLTAAPVNLAFVISAALETVRLAAEAKHIQTTLDLDPNIASISGDAARLQQVVWNLLTNAVKFTPQGGQVTIELRQIEQLAQIRVIDMGKGIASDFLPYVFEYFRQQDGSTTRKFGGLGLGLAIVRQIVEMHGGRVWAESQGENQGATFTVQLPVLPQIDSISSAPFSTQAHTEAPLDNVQILLVDDESDTREFQAFLLEQSGAQVTAVASGSKALQFLDQWIPDVIISDVGMAEMDGYMLIEQIRSRPLNRGGMIPAIALTAYAAEHNRRRALQAGFQMHLTKPLEPEQFISTIVSLLK